MADPAFYERMRAKFGVKPTAAPSDKKALYERLQKKFSEPAEPLPPVTETILPPPGPTPEEVKETTAAATAAAELEKSIINLRRELYDKIASEGPLSEEEINRRVEEEVKRRLPKPIYGGDFSLTRPQAPAIPSVAPPALATPENLPSAGVGVTEILGARTRAPERAAREVSIFDDVKFEKDISTLPPADQILERGAYEGFKAVYEDVKKKNEGISEKDAVALTQNIVTSINEAFKGNIKDGFQQPEPQYIDPISGQPAGMLTAPFTTTPRKMFKPNEQQSIYLNKFNEASKKYRRLQADESLKELNVPRLPGAAGMVITRKLSEAERKEKLDALEKSGAFEPPIEFQPQKMQEFMADPEKFATGGIIFDKEYPSGLVIESPTNQVLRVLTSPLNAMAGAIGYIAKGLTSPLGTSLEDISESRDVKYRGTGPIENIIYNIQTQGGFTKEVSDIGTYNKNLKGTVGEVAAPFVGFAIDLSGAGDIALLKGAAGAVRGGTAARIAAKEAGITGFRGASVIAGRAAGEGASAYLKELPLFSKYFKTELPDIRLTYGGIVADSLIRNGEMKDIETRIDNIVAERTPSTVSKNIQEIQTQARVELKTVDDAIANNTKRIDDATKEIDDAKEALNILNEDLSSYKSNKLELEAALKSDPKSVALKQKLDSVTDFLTRKEAQIKSSEAELRALIKRNNEETKALKAKNNELGVKREEVLSSQKAAAEGRDVKELASDVKNVIIGENELSSIKDLLPAALRRLSTLYPNEYKSVLSIANDLRKEKQLTTAELLKAIKIESPELFDFLKESIVNAAAFERGVVKIDDALSKVGLKGADLIALTPSTLATADAAKDITKSYERTPFYRDVILPSQTAKRQRAMVDGKLIDRISIDRNQVQSIQDTLFSVGKYLDSNTANRIQKSIDYYFINVDDLRELSYSVADVIAAADKRGINRSMLSAEIGSTKITGAKAGYATPAITPRGARAINIERRFEELTSDYPVVVNRIGRSIQNQLNSVGRFVDARSKNILENAKRRLAKMNEELRSEIEAVKTNPDIARALKIDGNTATNNEIVVALSTEGGTKGDKFAEHLLDSMLYSTDRSPLVNAVIPQYNWGKSILKNTEEYDILLKEVAAMTPQEVLFKLPEIFDRMKVIVEKNVNLEIKSAGGRTMSVPKELATDVLLATYARKKCDDIIAETLENVMKRDRIEVSEVLSGLEQARRGKNIETFNNYVDTIYRFAANAAGDDNYIANIIAKSASDPDVAKNAVESLPLKISKPGMKEFLIQEINGSLNNYKTTGQLSGILKDALIISDAYKTYELQDMLSVADLLISNKVPADRFVSPELALFMKKEIGNASEYKQFLNQVAILSDRAADGAKSAVSAMNVLNELWRWYNKGFYDLVLSVNPRFHGPNNFGAPLAIAYTTGRFPLLKNPWKNYNNAWQTVTLGKSPENLRRNVVAVTDRFGNAYTHGDLYDLAIKSGVFRSQYRALVPSDITTEMKKIVEPGTGIGAKAERFYEAPAVGKLPLSPAAAFGSPLGSMTDDMHRMTVVIDALRSGDTLENALTLGRKSLFDYGNITNVERMIASRFFMFYTYWRESTVQFIRNLLSDPLRMSKMLQLAPNLSKIMIGDQNARDLAFYYPPDWGTGRIMLKLEPGEKYNSGLSIALFPLPQSDALNFWAQALISPMSLLTGPQEANLDQTTDFQESVLNARLGPGAKLLKNIARDNWYGDQEIRNNRVPIEHAIIYHALGAEPVLRRFMPSLEWIPASGTGRGAEFGDMPGEMELYIDDEDSRFYAKYIKVLLESAGSSRAINDFARGIGGATDVIRGPYPQTWEQFIPQIIGATTTSGALMPSVTERKVIEQNIREVEAKTKELRERRLPKQ